MRIVGARYTRRAQCQEALLAVVRELADEVVVGIHDPDVLLRIVGADLHIVWPAPDLVPLRPVLRVDHLAIAIEHDDDVLPSPVDARPAIASPSAAALPPLGVALAVSRIGRPPPTGNLMLGPICGSQVVPRPS